MRTSRVIAAVAALLLPLLVGSAAPAAPTARSTAGVEGTGAGSGAIVTVADMSFSPARVRVGLGETVTWRFEDPVPHTATSDDGFFDTGAASGGAGRSVRFASAGSFGYHCTFHPMMVGKLGVPMAATGSAQGGWKLRWLAGDHKAGRSYDVQVRRAGGTTWTSFRKATTSGSGRFDPGAGSWQARARTLKGSSRSGWSPVPRLP